MWDLCLQKNFWPSNLEKAKTFEEEAGSIEEMGTLQVSTLKNQSSMVPIFFLIYYFSDICSLVDYSSTPQG